MYTFFDILTGLLYVAGFISFVLFFLFLAKEHMKQNNYIQWPLRYLVGFILFVLLGAASATVAESVKPERTPKVETTNEPAEVELVDSPAVKEFVNGPEEPRTYEGTLTYADIMADPVAATFQEGYFFTTVQDTEIIPREGKDPMIALLVYEDANSKKPMKVWWNGDIDYPFYKGDVIRIYGSYVNNQSFNGKFHTFNEIPTILHFPNVGGGW